MPASLSDLGKRLIGALSAANFIVVTAPDHIEVREVPGDDLLARMIMSQETVSALTERLGEQRVVETQTAAEIERLTLAALTERPPRKRKPPPTYATIRVHYVTDRQNEGTDLEPLFGEGFAAEGDARLSYGTCDVSIPDGHEVGEVERPSGWQREDPERHIVILTHEGRPRAVFYRELHAELDQASVRTALLFVHGFNVTFEEAIQRTAQLKSDLSYAGPVIAFCWPSMRLNVVTAAAVGKRAYNRAERNAPAAQRDLQQFLTELAAELEPSLVHLIAHSMGNRLLANSVARLSLAPLPVRFATVILAAPDIKQVDFFAIAAAVAVSARAVTLYASSKDRALEGAHFISAYPRAGDSGAGITIYPGIDSIDATAARTDPAGHGYVTNSGLVIQDVSEVLNGTGVPRFWLRPKTSPAGKYWRIVRTKY